MTNTSAKIVFFGTEDFSLVALAGLIDAGYHIAAVVTKPDSKKGRGQRLIPPAVKVLALQHDIPVWQPVKLAEIRDELQALAPATGVLVSYGMIIPQSIIDIFTPGIINVHPSLLPKYRGPSPIESAIKNGDTKTGVTIMQLSAKMDAGPIYTAQEYPLSGSETRPELYATLAALGTDLLIRVLPTIIDGSLPVPQNDDKATYCSLLKKADAWLDATSLTAVQAERLVRAYLGFPKSKLTVAGHIVVVTKAHVTTIQKTPLDIGCQDGEFLSIDELVAPSGRHMNGDAFLRGYAAGV
jgi:methionyl-tRNA formyltransferase